MSSRSVLQGLIFLAVIVLIGWLFYPLNRPEPAFREELISISSGSDSVEAIPPINRRELGISRPICFVDRLAPEMIVPPVRVQLLRDNQVVDTQDALQIDSSVLDEQDWSWKVRLDCPTEESQWATIPFRESISSRGDCFEVPFGTLVHAQVLDATGLPLAETVSLNYVVIPQLTFARIQEEAMEVKPFAMWKPGGFTRLLQALKGQPEKEDFVTVRLEDNPQGIWVQQAGIILAWVTAPGYGSDWTFRETTAGEALDLQFTLVKRPRVFGQVLDEDGIPLGGTLVDIGTAFGTILDPDLSILDSDAGFGLAAGGPRGQYRRSCRMNVWTDKDGRFSAVVPRGEYYAVTVSTENAFGFHQTDRRDEGFMEDIELNVTVKKGLAKDGEYFFRIRYEDGSPVIGGRFHAIIVNDIDWGRQFPTVLTDERGRAFYPWVEPPELVGPTIEVDGVELKVQRPIQLTVGSTDLVAERP